METKEKAVRLVIDHRSNDSSEWAAITTVATRFGMSVETLRKWVRQCPVDAGQEKGVTTEQAVLIRELRRKHAEIEQTVTILKAAATFFAGERPTTSVIRAFITEHRTYFGVVPIWGVFTDHGYAIAPKTYYAHLRRASSERSLWDTTITDALAGYYEPDSDGRHKPESFYVSPRYGLAFPAPASPSSAAPSS